MKGTFVTRPDSVRNFIRLSPHSSAEKKRGRDGTSTITNIRGNEIVLNMLWMEEAKN